ncbi:putative addiction module antidote protein [Desulfovibrio sp. OttesenSCG-928-A18]|nr:putative addiction module antidote protein [Desulfovibrio sp. OttesenSCG-928-A18]
MSTIKISEYDTAEFLDNEEVIAEYLAAAMEDENPDVFIAALATVARARGMTQLAKDSGLSRESLYKTLSPGAKPRFETIMKITKALGVPMLPAAVKADSGTPVS